jgi:seryl-tRNA synthetase
MNVQKIRADMIELRNLNIEITRLKSTLKQLEEKSNTLLLGVQNYLKLSNQQSISVGDFKIEATMKKKRERKKKVEKEQDVIQVLQNNGVRDAKRLVGQIFDSMKGEMKEKSVFKIDANKK